MSTRRPHEAAGEGEGLSLTPPYNAVRHGAGLEMPTDPDWTDDLDDSGDGELAVAPAFASGRARRPALQEAKAGITPIRTPKQSPSKAGLSLLLTHPIILRD